MLSYDVMFYFTAFARLGTLTEVAEAYHISQPTITRAMKKAEETFGVPLFDRTKNSIVLNQNGVLAAQEVSLLLKQTDEMIDRVRLYDKANRTITVGSAAAVQLPELVKKLSRQYPEKAITTEQKLPEELLEGLKNGTYQLIVLPYDIHETDPSYVTRKIGEEHLMFFLPATHRFARRKSLSLSEMNGESMLLYTRIGFWGPTVRAKMPDSRFLLQTERYSLQELIANSVLPSFVTDLTLSESTQVTGRVAVPIRDPEVNVSYYLTCRRENAPQFESLLKKDTSQTK